MFVLDINKTKHWRNCKHHFSEETLNNKILTNVYKRPVLYTISLLLELFSVPKSESSSLLT